MDGFLAMGLFAISVSVYGYWFSARTKGNRLILGPGQMGLAVVVLHFLAPFISAEYRTGTLPLILWLGIGIPLIALWGFFVLKELLKLRKQIQ